MVESLKRSVEELEPPYCPTCHLEMKWYRSVRIADAPTLISHFFQCPNCNRLAEVKTEIAPGDAQPPPPPKLSRSARAFDCAA